MAEEQRATAQHRAARREAAPDLREVAKGELLYEGKAKKVYRTNVLGVLWIAYKDDATAFNGEKRAVLEGKGALASRISARLFALLTECGIPNHFLGLASPTEQLVREVAIVPLEVVVRNAAAGSLAERLGLPEGEALPRPVVEWYYKNDRLGDPLVNEDHIAVLDLATPEQLGRMRQLALAVNDALVPYLAERGIRLVDFKLEFGVTANGELLVADEISPDTCRFWDASSGEKLDKDRFRRDLGGVVEAYAEIWKRIGGDDGWSKPA
ncbi:phosphoribosylaminoimidazolesuccinocarboxamide synthase [Calditerricola satsumensis]|uniref:Phosphoribosylaminoimidazole-succinocarboxamide synthase n=1 Tax=Calditerricola satsumensis TaxID=373054 RepID=A0A8J3FB94_9BACI|nr:phosphoribosylaminoimidazole-succinocarboxamide synthase [Calditerricola satsumensis]